MTVERLCAKHLASVAELERLCFSEPWSKNSLELLLRDGGVGFVAVEDGETLAYGGMTFVLDEGQITNIATHPSARRRGCARAILLSLCEYARKRGLEQIFLEVRQSNLAALNLYSQLGFEAVGERKGFYRAPVENAVIMKINLHRGE